MCNSVSEIISLFELYSFEVLDNTKPDSYLVFACKKGYFNNVEIVVFDDTEDIKPISAEYQKWGYAVKETKFVSVESIHRSLFNGFFDVANTKRRLSKNYSDFCESQSKKKLLSQYKYIPCNYIENENIISRDLIDAVSDQVKADSASLIIIEAPAGFGKTCTSYEIMNAICNSDDCSICLLAELSKNRKATLFKYVLYSEIDTNFNGLKYNLVESEIKMGNLPIIIDGFDELLSKSIDEISFDASDGKNEAKSMLKTISLLLNENSKAKIILTSRKSSIFTGQMFDDWISESNLNCEILRIELVKPNVYAWLGDEKAKFIQKNMPDLYYTANPILLNTLSSISVEDLENLDVNEVIQKYFKSLLDREKERQALALSNDEQLQIMVKLSASFVQFDITAEESKYIKEMLEEIVLDELSEYVNRYNPYDSGDEVVPDKEQFLMKLVHHAFLDRINAGKNEIGFINDFTFGYLVGQALMEGILSDKNLGGKHVDLIATSYQACPRDIKLNIYSKMKDQLKYLEPSRVLSVEQKLFNKLLRSFSNSSFDSFYFDSFTFVADYSFENCTFYNCSFINCSISINSFFECQFYNCKFIDIEIDGDATENKELIFVKCTGHEHFSEKGFAYIPEVDKAQDYKKIVLEQFWKPGKQNAELRCGLNTVYRGMDKNSVNEVDKALDQLINDGLIIRKRICYELVLPRINEIKEILGR